MAANIETIINKLKRYAPEGDIALLRRAYDFAAEKHKDQKRKTGEPYIIHPLAVTDILADLEMDVPSLAAGLLHDVIEDQGVVYDELAAAFTPEIATLVDGVTKLKLADFERRNAEVSRTLPGLELPPREKESDAAIAAKNDPRRKKRMETRSSAENLRKILLAMAKDFRVMVIKLADRLHNMRTLQGLSEERRKKVAEETMQIFAPLAHRLGIWQIKWQLEDLAFKNLYPEEYNSLTERITKTRREREKDISDAIHHLRVTFAASGMPDVEIQGRPKHLWSIYNKMKKQELDLSELYDLIALRVIVGERRNDSDTSEEATARERASIAQCYAAIGIVHTVFMPLAGKFDDYIARTKPNLYQSIHTKVSGPHGQPLEVQIRTWEMHRVAEFGVAAHWAYKERGEGAKAGDNEFERRMAFLRQQLFDWQQDSKDSSQFLKSVVSDLFTDQVFVFTPKGDVIDLPAGATPVDFAFRIHSDVGEHLAAAKVNGKIVPVSYEFQNGDICSVVTRPQAKPSLDWLQLAKSSHARSKIKHYFRRLRFDDNVANGHSSIYEELGRHGLPQEILKDHKRMQDIALQLNKISPEDLYAAVGFGDVALGSLINRLRHEIESSAPPAPAADGSIPVPIKRRGYSTESKLAIAPGGVNGVEIKRAGCCLPLPGDEVIGYISRGRGIMLHREGCINVVNFRNDESERQRLTAVDWQPSENSRFETGVILESIDRVGLLRDVTEVFSENKTFILSINTKSNVSSGTAILRIDYQAASVEYAETLMRKLRGLEDMLAVYRLGVGAEEAPAPVTNIQKTPARKRKTPPPPYLT
jgi:GTP pyrophosphokinase